MLVTTNLDFARWTEVFGDERMTTALLDRVTHRGHVLLVEARATDSVKVCGGVEDDGATARQRMPEELAGLIDWLARSHPIMVAIDGVDAAGKTTPPMGAQP